MRSSFDAVFALAVSVLLAACGGGAKEHLPAPSSRDATPTLRPIAQTLTPAPSLTIDVDACDRAPGADARFRVAAHDDGARDHTSEIELALISAIEHAGTVYGWTSTELFCVHVFSVEDTFVAGLQTLLHYGEPYADTFRDNSGTIHFDADKGRDAIFINTSASRSVPFAVTHEYLHIVQGYVEHGGAPVWFLEGISEWEAGRLNGDPDPEWLSSFVDLDELGLTPKLSQLANQHQWLELDDAAAAAYAKARLALMYLESIAGPDAAPALLTNEFVLEISDFEAALKEMTGLTIDELDGRLRPFANELLQQ